jgi:hypothetical protein
MNPQELSITLWAAARFAPNLPAPIVPVLQQAAVVSVPAMTGQAVSNCLWAVAVLQEQGADDRVAAEEGSEGPRAPADAWAWDGARFRAKFATSCPPSAALLAALAARLPAVVPELSGRGVAAAGWAISRLDFPEGEPDVIPQARSPRPFLCLWSVPLHLWRCRQRDGRAGGPPW